MLTASFFVAGDVEGFSRSAFAARLHAAYPEATDVGILDVSAGSVAVTARMIFSEGNEYPCTHASNPALAPCSLLPWLLLAPCADLSHAPCSVAAPRSLC